MRLDEVDHFDRNPITRTYLPLEDGELLHDHREDDAVIYWRGRILNSKSKLADAEAELEAAEVALNGFDRDLWPTLEFSNKALPGYRCWRNWDDAQKRVQKKRINLKQDEVQFREAKTKAISKNATKLSEEHKAALRALEVALNEAVRINSRVYEIQQKIDSQFTQADRPYVVALHWAELLDEPWVRESKIAFWRTHCRRYFEHDSEK